MNYKSRLQSRISRFPNSLSVGDRGSSIPSGPTSLSKSNEASGLKTKNGFSIIETIIVVAVLSVVVYASLGSLGSARDRASLRDAQASILYAFEAARSRAVTGVGTGDHGVHVEPDRIVAFEGSAYTGIGTETLLPLFVSTNQVSSTIIFSRLSAHASASTTVLITSPRGSTSTISVTYDGAIVPSL